MTKVGRRACHEVSDISESWCCFLSTWHQVQISESCLAHSSQPWTGRTMPEPEVVKFSKSRNESLMLLETRENNGSLRQLPLLNVNCFLIKCRQNQMMSEEFHPCATLEILQWTAKKCIYFGQPFWVSHAHCSSMLEPVGPFSHVQILISSRATTMKMQHIKPVWWDSRAASTQLFYFYL